MAAETPTQVRTRWTRTFSGIPVCALDGNAGPFFTDRDIRQAVQDYNAAQSNVASETASATQIAADLARTQAAARQMVKNHLAALKTVLADPNCVSADSGVLASAVNNAIIVWT